MYIEIDNKELRRIFTKEEQEKDLELFLSSLQLVKMLCDTTTYKIILGEE